jgi:hypothetical protein
MLAGFLTMSQIIFCTIMRSPLPVGLRALLRAYYSCLESAEALPLRLSLLTYPLPVSSPFTFPTAQYIDPKQLSFVLTALYFIVESRSLLFLITQSFSVESKD